MLKLNYEQAKCVWRYTKKAMMKKLYALYFLLLATGELFGQSPLNTKTFPLKQFPVSEHFMEKVVPYSASGERSVILSDDFSDTTHWVIATQGQGSWEIVNTTPADVNQYMGSMASTTAANGFALFNGIQYILAKTPATQSTTLTYYAPIDLSSYPNVAVQFEQRYRKHYAGKTFLEVSVDSINWTSIELNSGVIPLYISLQNTERVNVSSYVGGNDSVYIRYRWESLFFVGGGYSGYGWCVDDFKIVTVENTDLVLKGFRYYDPDPWMAFMGEVAYTQMPINQISELKFVGEIENFGLQSQNNVRLQVDVENTTPLNVFTGIATSVYLDSGNTVSQATSTNFLPGMNVQNYNLKFKADFDNWANDADTSNNLGQLPFKVTNNIYDRSDQFFTYQGLFNGEDANGNGYGYDIGVVYKAVSNAPFIVQAMFSPETEPGAVVCGRIYEVDQTTGDFILSL